MRRLVAIYRNPTYSPLQHLANDTAILDGVVARMADAGWAVDRLRESEVERGHLPAASLYLNMAQGPLASERLTPLELDGAVVANRATSVLRCHRHRLVGSLEEHAIPFPETMILPAEGGPPPIDQLIALAGGHPNVWVKRGDVHAERPEDVVTATPGGVHGAMVAFAARDVPWVAIQRHVPGPVVKFYAVADGSFFRWYPPREAAVPPRVDEERLRDLVFRAARAVSLDVFGGDIALPDPESPVLIDLNDWPSFAPCRDEAALAITEYVRHAAERRRESE
ncbi:MAG: hypothetical protein ACM3JJ_04265 [Hyphomicrobiales bacterium]